MGGNGPVVALQPKGCSAATWLHSLRRQNRRPSCHLAGLIRHRQRGVGSGTACCSPSGGTGGGAALFWPFCGECACRCRLASPYAMPMALDAAAGAAAGADTGPGAGAAANVAAASVSAFCEPLSASDDVLAFRGSKSARTGHEPAISVSFLLGVRFFADQAFPYLCVVLQTFF